MTLVSFPPHHAVGIEDAGSPSLHQMDDDAEVSLSDGVPKRGATLSVGSINVQSTLRNIPVILKVINRTLKIVNLGSLKI